MKKSSPVVCNATVPTSLSSSNIGSVSATVSWSPVAGATYDIRYRVVGASSWTTVPLSGTSYTITGLSALTQYEAQVRSKCSGGDNSSYSSSTTFTTTDTQLTYCDSNGNSVSDEYISNVAIGTINNPSGASTGGYVDYTSISTDLAKNTSHTITITPTWTGTVYSEGYSIWIDLNQDGDFSDSGEQLLSQNATRDTPVTGDFTIPAAALNGSTRMRVSMKYNGVPSPCESFQYGEVEDYTVNITGGGPGGPGPSGCTSGISSFPYNEGFENTLGSWTQSSSDDLDWTIDSNGTPSRNTGPSSATDGTYYIYVEASGNGTGYPNKSAIITSPCIDLGSAADATLSFSYHMYGNTNMGSIALEASTDEGVSWTSLWNQTGNQGNSWQNATIDLTPYTGDGVQLRFNRITGNSWQADIAIDNLSITTSVAVNSSIVVLEDLNFSIFPNPVDGPMLNLSTNNKNVSNFEIKNFVGQLVRKGSVSNIIDVSALKSGVYFLQVATKDQQVVTKRFVKK
nr:GEVED domain-containing protein [Aquimarina sp. AU474]